MLEDIGKSESLELFIYFSAADWPTDPVWSGKLKIVAKGRDATIILHDDKGAVFAKCPYNEGAVEKGLFLD